MPLFSCGMVLLDSFNESNILFQDIIDQVIKVDAFLFGRVHSSTLARLPLDRPAD